MMGNKVIEQIVNPFIRIAGMKALGWGVLGLAVSTWICWISGYHYHGLLQSCSQSGLVVLFGGAFDRVADSCVTVLSWRCFFVTFPHSYSRCVGHCAVCPVTVTGDEFN